MFGGVFLTLALAVRPELLDDEQAPVFMTTVGFARGLLGRPGGPSEYAAALLYQSYACRWLGPLVITCVIALICVSIRDILRAAAAGPVHPSLSFLPGVLLLVLHSRYRYELGTSVALLGSLAFVNLYVRILLLSRVARLPLCLAFSGAAWYVSGGMVVVFGLVCGILELMRGRSILLGALLLALAPAMPYCYALQSFQVGALQAYQPLVPSTRNLGALRWGGLLTLDCVLYYALLLLVALAVVWAGLATRLDAYCAAFRWRLVRHGPLAQRAVARGSWTFVSLSAFLIAGGILTHLLFTPHRRTELEVGQFARKGQWERALEAARQLPSTSTSYHVYVAHDANLALYHTGRLLGEMFSYPQKSEAPSIQLAPDESTILGSMKFSEVCLQLGQVNLAQHHVQPVFELRGPRPEILKLLFQVSMVKGRTEAARTFLGALSRQLLYRRWAKEQLRRLDKDPQLAGDAELQRLRSVMVTEDYGYGGFGELTYEQLMQELLDSNGRNRMAFEYLMAHYLLRRQVGRIAENIGRLENFDYEGIPRHCEEALAILMKLEPKKREGLHGRNIRPETERRYEEFLARHTEYLKARAVDREKAYRTLVDQWGGSYFFYFAFGFSGSGPG